MQRITIGPNEIAKGWARDLSQSNSKGIEAPAGYYSKSTAMSTYRTSKYGQLAPGETFTALDDSSTRVNALPLNGAVSSTAEAFVILDNARVVQFSVLDEIIDAHNATAAHGGHASITGEDILSYKNATNEYILYSWNDNTDGDVGRMLYDGSAADDDYMSTVASGTGGTALTKGVPHKMRIGPDKNIHITNGQYIAKFNPSTSAIDYQALNLGVGFVATGLSVYNNQLVIVGYKQTLYSNALTLSESTCFFWDTTSPFYQNSFDLKDNYASAIFLDDNSTLYVFTRGRNNTTKIKYFTGSKFDIAFQSWQIGDAPRQGSVDSFEGVMHFSPNSGGALNIIDGKAFHYRTAVTTDGSTIPSDIGMVRNLYSNVLFIGRKVGSSYTIVRPNFSGYHIDATWVGPILPLPYKSRVKKVIVYFSQFGSGASILFSLFKNYSTISLGGAADLANQTIDFTTYGALSSRSFQLTKAFDADCILPHIKFNHVSVSAVAAIIRKIEIYYDTVEKL